MKYYIFNPKEIFLDSIYLMTDMNIDLNPKGITYYSDVENATVLKVNHDLYWAPIEISKEDYYNNRKPRFAYVEKVIKCECGLDITGVGGMHSTWCPKFENN